MAFNFQQLVDGYKKKFFGDGQTLSSSVVSPLPPKKTVIPQNQLARFSTSVLGKGTEWLQKNIEQRTLPKVNLQQYTQNIKAPVPRFGAQLGAGLAENMINLPQGLLEGGGKAGLDIRTLRSGGKLTAPRLINTAASIADPLLDIATLGGGTVAKNIGKQAGKQVAKQTLKQAIKTGIVKGAGAGALYGGLYGLSVGDEAKVSNLLQYGGTGGLLGGALGGASAGVGGAIGKMAEAYKRAHPKASPKEVSKGLVTFIQDETTGKLMGSRSNKKEPVFYGDLRESLGLPRNGDYEVPVGFQAKPKGGNKAILEAEALKKTPAPQSGPSLENMELRSRELSTTVEKHAAGLASQETSGISKLPAQLQNKIQPSGGSSPSIIKPDDKYAFNVNKNRLDLTPNEKVSLDKTVSVIKPELQKIKGKALSNDEVVRAAKSSEMLQKVTSREQALKAEAAMLRARQRMVELDKDITDLAKKGNTKQLRDKISDLVESLKVVSSNASERGRALQSLSINAGDESIRTQMLKDITNAGAKTDEVVEAAAKVNWDNAQEVTKFYRSFVKPSLGEVIDEYRYNNMLSNPRTHIRNTFSNLVQTFVTRPATLAGQGRPVEAAKYYTGAIRSFPDAIQAFTKSFKGDVAMSKPDMEHISTTKLPKLLSVPTRAMEASDKFFSTLIKGGETARGASAQDAAKIAEYSLFRSGLKPEGQGKLLNAIDDITAWTYKAPKPVRWFVPFIRTPMNVAKQWIEYGPQGLATLPGSANKREQLGKAIVGSMVTAVGAGLAMEGRTTWAAPTDQKQKELFYATGRKPFSIKINDKWVSMQYLGPFALAVGIPAAFKFYNDESRTALTDSQIDKITKTLAGSLQLLSGQTFMDGLENFVKLASGDTDYTLPKNLAYTFGQTIPMEGLVRYMTTLVDPIYRKPKGFVEQLQSNVPFASQGLDYYTDPLGNPSKRESRNYVTPYDVTQSKPEFEDLLQMRTQKLQGNAVLNEQKKELEKQVKLDRLGAQAAGEEEGMNDIDSMRNQLELDLAKQKLDLQGGNTTVGDLYLYKDGDSVKTIDMSFQPTPPELTGLEEYDKEAISRFKSDITKKINDLYDLSEQGVITKEDAEAQIKALRVISGTGTKAKKKAKPSVKKVSRRKVSTPKIQKIKIAAPRFKNIKNYSLSVTTVSKPKITVPKLTKWIPKTETKYTKVR